MKPAPISPAKVLRRADGMLQAAVEDGVFPGAQVAVAHAHEVVWNRAYGAAVCKPYERPMELDTPIDLASLTKPLATATLLAQLVGEGRINLSAGLGAYFPSAYGTDKAGLTIAALLAHESGLPAYLPYYQDLIKEADFRTASPALMRRAIIERILREPLVYAAGTEQRYSDLDYILLGEMVAHLLNRDLKSIFQERIANPLGISTGYYFRAEESVQMAAATEKCAWRGEVLQGAVHDDHAWLMGGAAGHAGLFGTATDVMKLADAWLRAYHAEHTILPPDVVRRFWSRTHPEDPARTWALGWDTPTPGKSTAGKHFSPHSFGHLGFTGTSCWVDAERRVIVVLLTNRVHPSRSNERIRDFRPVFHDAVMEGLLAAGID